MIKVLAVSNRNICKDNFLNRIEKLAMADVEGIILREKDLSEAEYEKLAVEVLSICRKYNTKCILHNFYDTAIKLGCDSIHLPLNLLKENKEIVNKFDIIGVSTHSVKEAVEAEELGASYITAGHIFETDCKKGLMPRGVEYLKEVCKAVDIPVYAIGGINADNISGIKETGLAGVCIMSGLMMCQNPEDYIKSMNCFNYMKNNK